jgi:guanine deaminase
MIASPAPGLLPWLETYTFPTERQFKDPVHARATAEFFLDELLRNGTTTALVYCTVHKESVDALFEASERAQPAHGWRQGADGPPLPGLPAGQRRSARERGADQALAQAKDRRRCTRSPRASPRPRPRPSWPPPASWRALIRTPSSRPTSRKTRTKCNLGRRAVPAARSYLDVYDHYGLMRPRAMYGHCIWLDDDRLRAHGGNRLGDRAVCPTSNLFLGSGLFDIARADNAGALVSLGTDVGAGTSFSMLQTMNEAYKVARLKGSYLPALRMFYLATLGAARSMQLEGTIGNFVPGAEADFIVLDPKATPLLARRTAHSNTLEETLFALALLGDDRAIRATYAAGLVLMRRVHERTLP